MKSWRAALLWCCLPAAVAGAAEGALPLRFEANHGQHSPEVKFLVRGSGGSLLFTPAGMVVAQGAGSFRMRLAGGTPSPAIRGEGPPQGRSNYLLGRDPARWRRDIPNYARIEYLGVYPGIDLIYYPNGPNLEHDFVLQPGADPARIRIAFDGIKHLRLDAGGDLLLETALGPVRLHKPLANKPGDRRSIPCFFVIKSPREVGFRVGPHDPAFPLVIDPELELGPALTLGGLGDTTALASATDPAGNVYVTGKTSSTDLPTKGGRQPVYGGGSSDAFVAKFDPALKNLIYLTYLGGSLQDDGNAIAVDATGSAYVAGLTLSRNFPTRSPRQAALNGVADAFLAKLNPAGSDLVFSTYHGGSFSEGGTAVALDTAGNVYLAGTTGSPDFPTMQPARPAPGGNMDAFVSKFSPTADRLIYSTYLGGAATDFPKAIAVNAAGEAFVAGYTASADFPVQSAFQPRLAGREDGFLTRLSAQGNTIVYSTFLGGSGDDELYALALDPAGGAWVLGTTTSTDLTVSANARQKTHPGGGTDAFLAFLLAGSSAGGPLALYPAAALSPDPDAGGTGDDYLSYVGVPGASGCSAVWNRALYLLIGLLNRTANCPQDKQTRVLQVTGYPAPGATQLLASACGGCGAFAFGPSSLSLFNNLPKDPANTRSPNEIKSSSAPASPGSATATPEPSQTGNTATTRDPVSTATGELFAVEMDAALGGPLPLSFARYYGSFLTGSGFTGALGNNWMHNFERKLVLAGPTATVVLFGGRLVQFRQASGGLWSPATPQQFNYQLAAAGPDYKFLDAERSLIYTFSSAGALTRIEDRNGNALTVTQGPSGPTQVSDGLGRTLSFNYTSGRLMRVQDQSGRTVEFEQTGGDLTRVIDANKKPATYAYTASGGLGGLLVAKTMPAGNRPFTQTFDTRARVVRQADSQGNAATIDYNRPSAGVTTVTNPLAPPIEHTHAGQMDLTAYSDPDGQALTIAYDDNHRGTSVTDRYGDQVSVAYHQPSGLPSAYTDALGNRTTYTYAAQVQGPFTFHVPSQINYADGTSARMTYDAAGNLLSSADQAGKTWRYTYNPRGQLLTASNPAGGVLTSAYNADGTVASVKLPGGESAVFAHDEKKRPARVTYPGGESRTFTYDNRDRLLRSVDERGNATSYAYDDNGNLRSLTDPLGNAAALALDTDDRLSAVTGRDGKTSRFAYDEAGRLASRTNPAGDAAGLGYDAQGRLKESRNCSGNAARISYDREGVISSVTDPLSRTWSFSSDGKGRITGIADPLGAAYSFAYGSMGRLVAVTDPLAQAVQYAYDGRGLLAGASLPEGISAGYARHDLGPVTEITDPNGNLWRRSIDSAGRVTSRTDPLGRATSYEYDARGRPAKITFPEGSATLSYDQTGNLIRALYADGTDLQYAYDGNKRLVSGNGFRFAYDAEGRITASNGLLIDRDDAGRISAVTYAPGKTVRYSYDCRGLLVQVADWIGGATDFTYDDAGELLSITRPNGAVTRYEYDGAARLSSIVETGAQAASIALTRDAAGKVVSAERNLPAAAALADGAQQFAYDEAHQLTGAAYDALGRLVSGGGLSYTWDQASRLLSYSRGDAAVSFGYDAMGLPVRRTSPESSRDYVFNYALGLPSVAIVREGENDLRYYVHTPGGTLLWSIEAPGGARRFYHFDETGSTTLLSGDDGAVTDTYQFGPYGEPAGRSGSSENPFTWLGALGVIEEPAAGLYSMRFRFYSSDAARFLSPDPVPSLAARSLSPYAYVNANPLAYVDPWGLRSQSTSFAPPQIPAGRMIRPVGDMPDEWRDQLIDQLNRQAVCGARILSGFFDFIGEILSNPLGFQAALERMNEQLRESGPGLLGGPSGLGGGLFSPPRCDPPKENFTGDALDKLLGPVLPDPASSAREAPNKPTRRRLPPALMQDPRQAVTMMIVLGFTECEAAQVLAEMYSNGVAPPKADPDTKYFDTEMLSMNLQGCGMTLVAGSGK